MPQARTQFEALNSSQTAHQQQTLCATPHTTTLPPPIHLGLAIPRRLSQSCRNYLAFHSAASHTHCCWTRSSKQAELILCLQPSLLSQALRARWCCHKQAAAHEAHPRSGVLAAENLDLAISGSTASFSWPRTPPQPSLWLGDRDTRGHIECFRSSPTHHTHNGV